VENAKSSAPMAGSKVSGIEVKPHTAHGSSALEPNHWENYRLPVLSQPADASSAMARGKRMLFSRWMC
jgi:hypothetical protein